MGCATVSFREPGSDAEHGRAGYGRRSVAATDFIPVGIEGAAGAGREKSMRRFVIGAIVGGGMMYFYLYNYSDWQNWASGNINTTAAKYRGDAVHRQADQALR
jgi:hypothetical protein